MRGEPRSIAPQYYGGGASQISGREPANLGDILERVLDKGVVIAGDIRVNLLDIELLTIKLRLLIVSVETARELGIDWWERDPWLTGRDDDRRELEEENRRLRERLSALEESGRRAVGPSERDDAGRYERDDAEHHRRDAAGRDEPVPRRREETRGRRPGDTERRRD